MKERDVLPSLGTRYPFYPEEQTSDKDFVPTVRDWRSVEEERQSKPSVGEAFSVSAEPEQELLFGENYRYAEPLLSRKEAKTTTIVICIAIGVALSLWLHQSGRGERFLAALQEAGHKTP